jgi:transcriptional regulator with XRE-family HTH domain
VAKRHKLQPGDTALKSRFGVVVKTHRQRLGISQEELAWRAEMHRTYLADIERGKRNISLCSIVRLVNALGVTLAEFFFNFEEFFQSPVETPPAGKVKNGNAAPRVRVPKAKMRR